jgi:hypothetical protein
MVTTASESDGHRLGRCPGPVEPPEDRAIESTAGIGSEAGGNGGELLNPQAESEF